MTFAHTNIVSTDWKKLSDFYIKTFNCKMVPPIRSQSGKWLDLGTGLKNAQIEGAHLLLPGHGDNGHIAFEVDNVKNVLINLINNGGQVFGEVSKREVIGVGLLTFIYASDPEGNIIELQQWNRQKK